MSTVQKTSKPWKFLTYTFILVAVIVTLLPLYWMLVAASLPQEEFFTFPPRLLPGTAFIQNFVDLQENFGFVRSIINSLIISISFTVLSALVCSMGGFAFAKYEFRFRGPLFYLLLSTVVLPLQVLVIPLFLLMANLQLTDTLIAVILPWIAYPVGLFLMRQNMKSIPDSLLDAARIDGATELGLFFRIVLPSMKSSIAALAVILFLLQWNAFLYPLVVLQSPEKFTIPLAVNKMTGGYRVFFDQLMLASSLVILPMIVLFLWLQTYFEEGLMSGSIKQ